MEFVTIIKTPIALTSYDSLAQHVLENAHNKVFASYYFANVHMLMEAYDSNQFAKILVRANTIVPDGRPLVWVLKALGYKHATQVYGPHFFFKFLEVCEKKNIAVGLLGSTSQNLNALNLKLLESYPKLSIEFKYAPPFGELSAHENNLLAEQIRHSNIQILFVAFGCPRQETWVDKMRDKLSLPVLAVGAAFDFHSGRVKQSPEWLRVFGLEWFYRLMMEPKRLWKRYLKHNPRFILLAIKQIVIARLRQTSS